MKKVYPSVIQTLTSETREKFTKSRVSTTYHVEKTPPVTMFSPMFTVVNACKLKTYCETVNIDFIFTINLKVKNKKWVNINTTMGRFTQNPFQRSPAPDFSEVNP
jgi:hypothetical protein